MHPWIPWQRVAESVGSPEHALGTAALRHIYVYNTTWLNIRDSKFFSQNVLVWYRYYSPQLNFPLYVCNRTTVFSKCYLPNEFLYLIDISKAHRGALLVEALRYKPEGRGFDSQWGQCDTHWHNPSGRTMVLGSTRPLREMSTRTISWGLKVAGA